MRIAMGVLALYSLNGCIDQGFGRLPFGYNAADHPPEIEVVPGNLDFGELGPHESAIKSFVVRNVSESQYALLDVHEISLSVPTGFTFVTNDTEAAELIAGTIDFDLGTGMEETLFVRFAPDAPVFYEAMAMVRSNDEGHPAVPVQLEGVGLIPKLDISPNPLNFGEVTVTCERESTFMLTNVGNAPLTVASLSSVADEAVETIDLTIAEADSPLFPFMLEPGMGQQVTARFTPSLGIAYAVDLVVQSDDPVGETRAAALGTGYVPGQHRQRWELEVNPQADVLFVVDRSVSMEDDHESLSDNFSHFIWAIDDYTPNWRVLVGMPDDGCNMNGIIDRTVDDYDEVFEEAVTEDAEPGSLFTEAGLIVANRAIEATDSGECNDGYMRDDAYLHIILVADEPEQSPFAWNEYVEEIIAKKGDRTKVKISAVAGDYPWGCVTEDNNAEAGTGYYEATRATYGKFLSLCDSWYRNSLELAKATVRRDTFPLDRWPDPATVQTWLNGTPAEYWHYDANMNAVVFDEFEEPREGDVVEVEYHDPYSCD